MTAGLAPDVVLMDIRMPNMNGIDALGQILEQYPKVQVIALSGFADQAVVEQAIQAGASGFLLKTSPATEIATAIRTAMDGRIFLSPDISNGIIDSFCKQLVCNVPAAPPSHLSEREVQVLRLVVEGLKTKDIAARLGIGPRTVETYRDHLKKKLHCATNSQLISWAIQEGIATA
jgi:DNA-binding NarL/FixJ family response regulator